MTRCFQITLLGEARDEKRSASTNSFGSYRIDDLLPGAYTVTAQHDGFQAVTVSPIFVEVNQKVRVDIELTVGSVHDTATVSAHAPFTFLHRRFIVVEGKSLEPHFGPFFGKALSAGNPRRMPFASRFDF